MTLTVSASTFDPANPSASLPSYPSVAELLTGLQQALNNQNGLVTNYNAGGITETYLEALCINLGIDASSIAGVTLEGAYELLYEVAKSAYASTASDVFLDLKGADVGVFRKGATSATGPLMFSITQPAPVGGRIIPIGTLVAAQPVDPTQAQVTVQTTVIGVIPQGATSLTAVLTGEAVNAGSAGDVAAGAINTCLSDGTLQVTNPAAFSGGTDEEQDDVPVGAGFRSRVLAAIPNSSQCTIAAIEEDALAFPITSAVLVENTADDGVTPLLGRGQLYIDDGSGNLGDPTNPNYASLIALQNAIDSGLYRAAGTQVHVRGAIMLPISIALSVYVSAAIIALGESQDDIVTAIQEAIFSYVDAILMGQPVTVAKVIASARDTQGCSNVDVASVQINGVAADLLPAVYQLPRIYPTIDSIVITVLGVTNYS